MCHFRDMKGRYPNRARQEYDRLMITIWRALLDAFWSRETGTVRGDLTIMRNMVMMAKEWLGLEGWFPLLGTYILKDEVGMVLAFITLSLSLRNGGYVGHLQWDIMSKSPTEWANLYGY